MTHQLIVSTAFDRLSWVLRREREEGLKLTVCVDEEFRKFISQMLDIQDVLEDAESRQFEDPHVEEWLKKLRSTFYDIEETFDGWTTRIQKQRPEKLHSSPMRKVCSSIRSYFTCNRRVILHGEIAVKIKYVNNTLRDVGVEKDKFNFKLVKGTGQLEPSLTSPSINNMSQVYGRDEVKDEIIKSLVEGSSEIHRHIISVVGQTGIGKTALAREVFNDEKVKNHFNKRIWVCADPFNENRVAMIILESLNKDDAPSSFVELGGLLRLIERSNKKEKFLLVLDDVDSMNDHVYYWKKLNDALMYNSKGSRILVTLQKSLSKFSIATKLFSLKTLSDDVCWSLCSKIALSNGPNGEERKKLEEIGQKIVKKCQGLPLCVKILGSLLRFKKSVEEWESVLNSDIWELEKKKIGPVFPLLLLSYCDLPFILRKCFLYCVIFPKNYEIEKDRLIKLWMSQSYLIMLEEERDDMESIGEVYFNNLALRSFFQDFQINEHDGSIVSCKMHSTVSEFAQFLAKNKCFHMEAKKDIDVRHLMIKLETVWSSFPKKVHAKYHKERLRSLLVEPRGGFLSNIELPKLFAELTGLRALDLSNQDNSFYKLIKKVPGGIENLVHLRYLNFSNNKAIRALPETLCELYNLQTLEVSRCSNLERLPQRMEKLINLRHIVNDKTSLSYLPKGIMKLTRLRTLSEFIVCENDGINASKACRFESLKDMEHLRGSLSIKKLGNHKNFNVKKNNDKSSEFRKTLQDKRSHVNLCLCFKKNKETGTGHDEDKSSEFWKTLQNKRSLVDLCLCFKKDKETGTGLDEDNDDPKFFEKFQLPPEIMRLKIVQYRGKFLSHNWVGSLKMLRSLTLNRCKNLNYLPQLGKLSSLESLTVRSSRNVETLSNEFLGLEITDSKSLVEAFSKLKHLEFEDMRELKEWNYDDPRKEWITNEKKEDVKIMPRIEFLTIAFCPKLEALPNFILQSTTLKELKIISCPKMNSIKETLMITSHPRMAFVNLKYIEKGSH